MSNPHRARLVRFYEKHNPDKLPAVDAALASFAGREAEMFGTLVKKYGPEPEPPRDEAKARLISFYEKHNPDKLSSVEAALNSFDGRWNEMFAALQQKYPESGSPTLSRTGSLRSGASPRGPGGDYKARLVRFYKQYNKEKLAAVDGTLQQFRGKEEEMFEALVKKYGPEPSPAASSAASPERSRAPSAAGSHTANIYRARLVRFYETYNKEKVPAVDAALQAFAGREEEMFEALVKKYGPEPGTPGASPKLTSPAAPPAAAPAAPAPAPAQPEPSRDEAKVRLTRFYEAHNPDKLSSVEAALNSFEGRWNEMFAALVQKYGPEPSQADVPRPAPHASPQSPTSAAPAPKSPAAPSLALKASGDGHSGRLTRFYEKYAPAKVPTVEAALEKYKGQEEALFDALVKKYGPEPQPEGAPSSAASPTVASPADRIRAMYETYAPGKLSTVDGMVEKYKGQEEQLIQALVTKYGPEPSGKAAPAPAEPSKAAPSPAAQPLSWRDRLVCFYEKYAPAKVPTVDAALEKYKGQEEALMQALVTKYGPEPAADASSPPKSPASVASHASSFAIAADTPKARLTRFYEKYAPAKVPTVEATLEKYKGQEEALFDALVKKYGPEPQPEGAPSSAVSYEDRVRAMYETYAPAKLATVPAALAKYKGQEAQLLQALVTKYGPEPASTSSATSPTKAQPPSWAERLTRFYEKYAPAKVPTVEATLEKYKGQEEALFDALVKKYGPEPEAPSAAQAAPPADTPNARLTRFYEQYAPAKVSTIEATLEKYKGQEEALFDALVKKYGPEPPAPAAAPAPSPTATQEAEAPAEEPVAAEGADDEVLRGALQGSGLSCAEVRAKARDDPVLAKVVAQLTHAAASPRRAVVPRQRTRPTPADATALIVDGEADARWVTLAAEEDHWALLAAAAERERKKIALLVHLQGLMSTTRDQVLRFRFQQWLDFRVASKHSRHAARGEGLTPYQRMQYGKSLGQYYARTQAFMERRSAPRAAKEAEAAVERQHRTQRLRQATVAGQSFVERNKADARTPGKSSSKGSAGRSQRRTSGRPTPGGRGAGVHANIPGDAAALNPTQRRALARRLANMGLPVPAELLSRQPSPEGIQECVPPLERRAPSEAPMASPVASLEAAQRRRAEAA